MSSRRSRGALVTRLLVTGAGIGLLTAFWLSRRQHSAPPVAAEPSIARSPHAALDDVLRESLQREPRVQASVVVEPRPEEPQLTAVPRVSSYRFAAADDYESIAPEGLGAAYLSRATDSAADFEPGDFDEEGELAGFQIATLATLTTPELSDDPVDFVLPRARAARRG